MFIVLRGRHDFQARRISPPCGPDIVRLVHEREHELEGAALQADHVLPIQPTLGPEGLRLLAGRARLNTDDQPWVEFEAPRWLLRSTGSLNQQIIAEAAARSGGR